MKIVDAVWEQKNLGKKTAEIVIGSVEDEFNISDLLAVEENFEYVVVKVNSQAACRLYPLQESGYKFIETQISLTKNLKRIEDNNKLDKISKDIKFTEVNTYEDFVSTLNELTLDMFYTDRIALDPEFGVTIANKRYRNWLTDEFNSSRSQIFSIERKDKKIGFAMARDSEESVDILLGGIFSEYQNLGLGYNLIYQPIKYYEALGKKRLNTKVSSNNMNVIKLYMDLGYTINGIDYILVKHILNSRKTL